MKRFLLPVLVIIAVIVAGVVFWPHSAPSVANTDPRALTAAEQAIFLPQACAGASAGSGGFAQNCASLPGYPSKDYGGAGLGGGLGITLTSVAYGNFLTGDEAYVSYQGSFESHATNFGGGVLFSRNSGTWELSAWYPGYSLDGCVSLTPTGEAQYACVRGSSGQGETDTALVKGVASYTVLLKASDLRGTMDPEANCKLRHAGQDVLLSIDSLTRTEVTIEEVPAAVADSACAAHHFADAPVTKTTLPLTWDGTTLHLPAGLNFAPAE